MKKLLEDFAGNTTAHGWGNVIKSTTKIGKAVWIVITSGCCIVALYLIINVIIRYGQFDTKDRVRVTKDDAVFPSVTICPLSPVSRKGVVNYGKDVKDNFELSAFNNLMNTLEQYDLNISNLLDASQEVQMLYNQSFKRLNTNSGQYENFQLSQLLRYTMTHEDFIPSCKYQGNKCKEEPYRSGHHAHFNCFTYNGPSSNIPGLTSEIAGPTAGLSLLLFLDTDEDFSTSFDPDYPTSGSQGVRVVIHDRGTLPDPENDGFDIKAGNSVNVALSAKRRELMIPPWGECVDHNDIRYDVWKYSTKACTSICLQRMIYKTCGCILGSLPVDDQTKNAEFCANIQAVEWLKEDPNVTILRQDLEQLNCSMQEYTWTDVLAQEGCECKENCSNNKYDITISESQWPMKGIEFNFYCKLIVKLDNYENSSIYDVFHQRISQQCSNNSMENIRVVNKQVGDDLREQFIRLNVYFKDLDTKITTQTEDFTLGSMVSEIGGSLGLLVGMSVISMTEAFVLWYGIIVGLLTKFKRKSKVETLKDKMKN
ncbi:unnamed protein product [Owenia fusiformis]|uniref:Uncharacterized protein n=1 Tax=Owenia fusiformis TaxID=6347 RepID=A0A8J1UN45_OWEFU|nr:unnamed protein product [Owenia fusiformis]